MTITTDVSQEVEIGLTEAGPNPGTDVAVLIEQIIARRRSKGQLRVETAVAPTWTKVFGIGLNKTGTTSLATACEMLGLNVAEQYPFERLFDEYVAGNHQSLFKRIQTYDMFQDIPFSIPGAHRLLYHHYPDAKFVLTVRDSPEQWYESIRRYHAKLFARQGDVATEADLARAGYVKKGWMLRVMQHVYPSPTGTPYDANSLMRIYQRHIDDVQEYFVDKPGVLLVLNAAWPDAFEQLSRFLGLPAVCQPFPHLNSLRSRTA